MKTEETKRFFTVLDRLISSGTVKNKARFCEQMDNYLPQSLTKLLSDTDNTNITTGFIRLLYERFGVNPLFVFGISDMMFLDKHLHLNERPEENEEEGSAEVLGAALEELENELNAADNNVPNRDTVTRLISITRELLSKHEELQTSSKSLVDFVEKQFKLPKK